MPSLHAAFDTQLYGYVPTQWVCVVFIVFFALSTIAHTGQAIHGRLPWLLFTIVPGGLLEVLGWCGRLWNSINKTILDGYLMQICCLILAPAFIMASNYLILGLIINKLGLQYSRIAPKWYTIVFCTCDVISLVVQAIGGGSAAVAVQSSSLPRKDPNVGARIMVGGIIFQMAVMVLFTILGAEFLYRWSFKKPVKRLSSPTASPPSGVTKSEEVAAYDQDASPELEHVNASRNLKLLILGVSLSTLFIFIRSIYRTIELLDGWTGPIIANQQLFNFLDGMMIIFALLATNFLHPGFLLDTRNNSISLGMKRKKAPKVDA
ncbi:RTA1-like protein [Mrakia frigida]|uniref:RTA1 domain-containing protein n=1 Tax=Mrakia frigida TaxID=29902 RepID=UPI003FCC264B